MLCGESLQRLSSLPLADAVFALSGRLLAYASPPLEPAPLLQSAYQALVSKSVPTRLSIPAYHVSVLDLSPLLNNATPTNLAHFATSHSQPVAHLVFSSDGCSLLSVPHNAQVARIFSLQPPSKLYDLRRGRTPGIVHDVRFSTDARWVAMGTKNRTLHIFPINPLGGPPNVHSHLTGRVTNLHQPVSLFPSPFPFTTLTLSKQPHPVQVSPLIRLRPLSSAKSDSQPALAFTFISSRPPGNTQDLLVFDPTDRVLSLRRITLHQRPKDPLSGLAAVVSRSLPSIPIPPRVIPAQENVELGATTHVVATWPLQSSSNNLSGNIPKPQNLSHTE